MSNKGRDCTHLGLLLALFPPLFGISSTFVTISLAWSKFTQKPAGFATRFRPSYSTTVLFFESGNPPLPCPQIWGLSVNLRGWLPQDDRLRSGLPGLGKWQ